MRAALAIVRKDLRIEWRTREGRTRRLTVLSVAAATQPALA